MRTLDLLTQPLAGLHLIEASAGTGKTYAIASLYLRLLLERGLELDRVLVVTFTEAATEELRERIRRRLLQALDWLQRDGAGDGHDPLLAQILERLPDRPAAAVRLADALTRMDEASVHTIHGFCQRMLQDNAFESGVPFEAEFITDETHLRRTVMEDFWRRETARMAPAEVAWLRGLWATPRALLEALQATFGLERVRLLPELDETDPQRSARRVQALFAELVADWHGRRAAIAAILRKSPALNRRSYTAKVVGQALAAMDALAAEPAVPERLDRYIERFTPTLLAAQTKPGQAPPDDPFFARCGALWEQLPQFEAQRRVRLLARARAWLREQTARRKAQRRQLYFDDLLRLLARALEGAGGGRLAAAIRARFPVALIDEFQDTDPLQYGIFRRVYREAPDTGLFLIGDPKQAIYAFRGADVFTYLQAREDARESQCTLGTNWRSGSGLVRAVNTLFGQAHRPFVFEPAIGFHPVAAGGKADAEPLTIDGAAPIPLQFWFLPVTEENQTRRPPGFIRADAARASAAVACAGRIAELLALGAAGRARIGDTPLRPHQIALLVRTHREGDELQAALREYGVASVTLSQDSVFDSEDALELETLLRAVSEPGNEGLARAALATAILGVSASGLHRLGEEEQAWEALLGRFLGYRALWLERGFMVAFQRLLAGEGVAARLLARPDGERRLTNLLQLGELLQVASREQPGLDGLLRWLADQRNGGERDETRQLRLESDQALVQIVTWHKCKGLQYPLVFIPFPWSLFGDRSARHKPVLFHDPGGRGACLDLGSEAVGQHLALQEQEALAERLRLFYVALTRAQHHCLLCWGRVNGAERSAPAWLLYPDREAEPVASRMRALEEGEQRAGLETLAGQSQGTIGVATVPEPGAPGRRVADAPGAGLAAARFDGVIDTRWRVSSYSGLASGGEEAERPDYDAQPLPEAPAEETVAAAAEPPDPVFLFPRGTRAGHFLHELLELLDFPNAHGEALERVVAGHLARYGNLRTRGGGETDWRPVLVRWLGQILDTPLAPGLRLRELSQRDRRNELEFHFSLARLDVAGLRRCLARFPDYVAAGEGLAFEPRAGLMRGFIDLVFRHAGRYYLVDYKSNHLGDRLADYAPERLVPAMRAHRYDLQYLIYTVALHRWLGQRLPDYAYERHFGGAYYLFLRGMRPQQGAHGGVWHDRPPRDLVAALDRLFGGDGEGAA